MYRAERRSNHCSRISPSLVVVSRDPNLVPGSARRSNHAVIRLLFFCEEETQDKIQDLKMGVNLGGTEFIRHHIKQENKKRTDSENNAQKRIQMIL